MSLPTRMPWGDTDALEVALEIAFAKRTHVPKNFVHDLRHILTWMQEHTAPRTTATIDSLALAVEMTCLDVHDGIT